MKCFTFLLMGFLSVGGARAAVMDFHVGKFTGIWCQYGAYFTLTTQVRNTWKFRGEIFLPKTGQVDDLTVIQNSDDSLTVLRSLSGASRGRTQSMVTSPPARIVKDGHNYVLWESKETHGTGCEDSLGYILMPY